MRSLFSGRIPFALSAAAFLALTGCEDIGLKTSPIPKERPAGLATSEPEVIERTAKSRDLERYYLAVQNDLLARGLLRTDGGGPDTLYDADTLAQNFETIAFFDEYTRGTSGSGRDLEGELSRWSGPVRIETEFGSSVPLEQREKDAQDIRNYTDRLARLTGHSISSVASNANFHVFVAGEDDRAFVLSRFKDLIPNLSTAEEQLIANLPRSYYCLVIATSNSRNSRTYTRAVALIRAEHPDLQRLSCIHEEIAQGLGLPNDSPQARPSIFNDDDEFALLTSHDEKLLTMLYDPRLKAGITAAEARPVTRIIARELMGQEL